MRDTTETFIEKARRKHGDKFDYSKVDYRGNYEKVCIICPKHGPFWQTPNAHLHGHWCPNCWKETKLNQSEFIRLAKEAHGDKYDYRYVDYKSSYKPVRIVCPEHGPFFQTPYNHICLCSECNKCSQAITNQKNTRFTPELLEETNKKWNRNYDFSKFVYEGYDVYGTVICPEHGEFKQSYHHLQSGNGCPTCGNSRNVSELRLKKILDDEFGNVEYQKTFKWLRNKHTLKYDFYLPDYNIAIEYQGRQHFVECSIYCKHDTFEKLKERDLVKIQKSKEHGVKLYHFTFERNYIPSDFNNYYIYTDLDELINKIKEDCQ